MTDSKRKSASAPDYTALNNSTAMAGIWTTPNWSRLACSGSSIPAEVITNAVEWHTEFEKGAIYWKSGLGAYEIRGPIRARWMELNHTDGFLGFPITDQQPAHGDQAAYNHFEGGSIYWSEPTKAAEISGDLRAKWNSLGGYVPSQVFLRAGNGQYVTATRGGGEGLLADGAGCSAWQVLRLCKAVPPGSTTIADSD